MLDYIEGYAVIQRLNDAFDGSWSFKIIHHKILKDSDEVIVIGELRAGNVIKNQFGSSQITRAKENKNIISLSDDLKAATTDCINPSFRIKKINPVITAGYFFKIFIMALLLFILTHSFNRCSANCCLFCFCHAH